MKRTTHRIVRRVQGDHPRKAIQPSKSGLYLISDTVLLCGLAGLVAGLALIIWGLIDVVWPSALAGGVALIAAGCGLIWFWERSFWEPFEKKLEQLS